MFFLKKVFVRTLILSFLILNIYKFNGQNLEKIGKEKLFDFSGGLSANGVFYQGNSNRLPFTFFVGGNINISVSGIYNIPLSFSYSNQKFDYSHPFSFNRISLHPSYKWVTAHIGDVSMSFSPYTLSGHQFTGLGFDLTPKGKFKISAMYGRFLKASEYTSENPKGIVAYDRFGYGFKTSYEFENFDIELIFFKAKDQVNSLKNKVPVELQLSPKDNAVVSAKTIFSILENGEFSLEYAYSGVTENILIKNDKKSSKPLSFLLKNNSTTNFYKALKMSLNYSVGNGTIGVGYERVDPNYKTLGAYFFNNDLENITVNATQTMFKKLNLSVNAGLQRDNLDNSKSSNLNRRVTSVAVNYSASEKLSLSGGYSNFQSFTNIKDQFEYINQVTPYENLDTLSYRQVSQNANLSANYEIKRSKIQQQNIGLNLLYQDSKNYQENTELKDQSNDFYNASTSYSLAFLEKELNFSLSGNLTYNKTKALNNVIWGPTLAVSKQFFNKKLRTQFSTSYNTSSVNGLKQNDNLNFRLSSSYQYLKSHSFGLNSLSLHKLSGRENKNDFTVIFSYNYIFNGLKRNSKKQDGKSQNNLSFRYKDITFRGTKQEISEQLEIIKQSDKSVYVPSELAKELNELLLITKQQKENRIYKRSALTFLKSLDKVNAFKQDFKKWIQIAVRRIQLQGRRFEMDREVEGLAGKHKQQKKALIAHSKLQKEISLLVNDDNLNNPTGKLKGFIEEKSDKVYMLYNKEKPEKIILFVEQLILEYYTKTE